MHRWRASIVAALCVLALAALPVVAWGDDPPVTTISITKTAQATGGGVFNWTLQKEVLTPGPIQVPTGETMPVTYRLTGTRIGIGGGTAYVSGEVCVTNTGDLWGTSGLTITDQVQVQTPSGYQGVPGATWTLQPAMQPRPGERLCYPYEIVLTNADAGASYRNVATATIYNHEGHWLEPYGLTTYTNFTLGQGSSNASADLTDVVSCPAGFTCTPLDNGWTFTGSQVVEYTVLVTNDAWGCDTTATLGNTATLVPSDDAPIKANGVVQIYTGPCSQGCTRTIGYWKTHAGFNGKNPDRVTPLLPVYLGEVSGAKTKVVASSSAAVQALSMKWGNPSNGITKLYAQLLGTKLSIRSGADGSVVYGIIQDADAFLANYNENDWSSLNQARRKMVLAWVSAFDDFNNGLLGPAHCD